MVPKSVKLLNIGVSYYDDSFSVYLHSFVPSKNIILYLINFVASVIDDKENFIINDSTEESDDEDVKETTKYLLNLIKLSHARISPSAQGSLSACALMS